MKKNWILLATGLYCSAVCGQTITNRFIDYPTFQRIVVDSAAVRENHRLTERQFLEAMGDPNTILLDARSAAKFDLRHIKGAVNLPFTEFTAEALATVIPLENKSNLDLLQ